MKKYQTGDTLTAVLVSVAIIGLMLAVAYFSLNKSTRQSIDSRELTKIEKAVQGQIEAIKYLAANDHNRHFFTLAEAAMGTTPQTGFCIDTSNQVLSMADLAQPTNTRQCDLGDFPDSASLILLLNTINSRPTFLRLLLPGCPIAPMVKNEN